jgi:hypothetical protein
MFMKSDSAYHGYVSDLETAYVLIEEFSNSTHTFYVKKKSTINFGKFDCRQLMKHGCACTETRMLAIPTSRVSLMQYSLHPSSRL